MYFYLKWCAKKKKNTKSQPKKIICKTVNFGSKKLTKTNKKFIKTQKVAQYFHNTFIILLYFI